MSIRTTRRAILELAAEILLEVADKMPDKKARARFRRPAVDILTFLEAADAYKASKKRKKK